MLLHQRRQDGRYALLQPLLLSIRLVREIPEAMKPKKIDIGGGEQSAIGKKPASQQTINAEAEHA